MSSTDCTQKPDKPLIVKVDPTVMDGQVVRWYISEYSVTRVEPIVSASRNGVRIDGWLHDLPEGLLDTARNAWQTLRRGGDCKNLATHYSRPLGGDLVAIVPDKG